MKPKPDFTLLDLLQDLKEIEPVELGTPPSYQEEGYFRVEELSLILGKGAAAIRRWIAKLKQEGQAIEVKEVEFVGLDDKVHWGTAYKLKAKSPPKGTSAANT